MIPFDLRALADQLERLSPVLRAVADQQEQLEAANARLLARLDEIAGDASEAALQKMEAEIQGRVVTLPRRPSP